MQRCCSASQSRHKPRRRTFPHEWWPWHKPAGGPERQTYEKPRGGGDLNQPLGKGRGGEASSGRGHNCPRQVAKPVGTATASVVDAFKSPALRIQSPLKFVQGGSCPREARGAEKSKFLQRKMLMPIGLLHESPSQGRQGTPVSHPGNIHSPAEDLTNKNTRYLVGQGDPQCSRDALANGL